MIKGKHATYAKFLCATSSKKDKENERRPADVFDRIVDIYMIAPIVGLVTGLKSPEDTESADETRIFAEAVIKEKANLEYIFRLTMLVDNSQQLTADEKISRAFRSENEELRLNLFNSYVRGGIEWLYDNFTNGATTHDEYIAKINEIVSNFALENGIYKE
jgi:hypothetical protein